MLIGECPKTYSVYRHTAPNGKVYIGITSKKPEKRWDNGKGYISSNLMWRAIQKYGWENFSHEILARGLTKQEAEAMEVELIQEHKSYDSDFGYNLDLGGNAVGRASEQTRAKMSASRRGHPTSEATRKRISESHKGVPWSEAQRIAGEAAAAKRRGIPLKEEHKQKIGEALTGRIRSEEYRQHIREAHLGRLFHTEETRRKISESKKNSSLTPRGSNNHRARSVVCLETGVAYETITAAALAVGAHGANISRSCRGGGSPRCCGYHWIYQEEAKNSDVNI